MSETIGQQPWMTAPRTMAVLDALEAAGGADCARFVGGCVRNTLIGRPISDIDIATVLTPDQVTAALHAAGLRSVPTGVEHGTVTAISDHKPFEITTLRRDVETDGRRAVVAFTTDWREDAERRDFTLNSLYALRDGTVFDPTGHGVADALAGRIVFVGHARTRLREDHLRSLRFFRFLAWYGRGEPDAEAVAAIGELKSHLTSLAAERVSGELLKLLAAEDPRAAVALMARTGVTTVILPEAGNRTRFEALVEIERTEGFAADAVLRLTALLPDDTQVGRAMAERLRLSNAERDRITAALARDPAVTRDMSPAAAREAIYRRGSQSFADRVKLEWAAESAPSWRELLALSKAWSPPTLPLSGEDVIAAGVAKGPHVGRVLREVEAWWIEADFPGDRAAVIHKMKAVVRERGG